jgi:ABC-type nitrate/sulfonate/bicarbonate transport system permease component
MASTHEASGPQVGVDRTGPTTPPTASPARRVPASAWPFLSAALALGALQALVGVGILPSRYFPSVPDLVAALGEQVRSGQFWAAVGQTLQGTVLGLLLAAVLAIPLGILIGVSEPLYRATRFLVEFLRPIPSVALIPLVVLVYGTGLQAKLFLVAFASFWPLLLQTMYGVRDVDPVARDTALAFGFNARRRLVLVTLPSALPFVATGLRIACTVALILAITAELVIGAPGLGRAIGTAQESGAVAATYALIAATGILGILVNGSLQYAERRVLGWHAAYREVAP